MKNHYEIRGDITAIFVNARRKSKPIETIIDTCDLEKAMSIDGTWSANYDRRRKCYYTQASIKGYAGNSSWRTVPMARFLFDEIPPEMVIDHSNHDTLDNRRSVNLKIVTRSENAKNINPKRKRYKAS